MEKLVFLIKGPRRSARLHLDGPFFVIGRAEPFPVFHDDPTLSREHAAVVETPEGYKLKDLGSRNGVLLNGERLERYAEVPLGPGDVFRAGDTTVACVTQEEVEARQAAAAAASGDSVEDVTVDDAGNTGYQLQAVSLEESGEVTGELILDPGDDEAWTDGTLDGIPAREAPSDEEPSGAELGEEDLLPDAYDEDEDLELE
ncbi:MAG: FHA domain-containing protein [Planctomycetota bacterium]